MFRTSLALAVVTAAVVGVPATAGADPGDVSVQIIAINDLHGRIAPTTGDESRLVTGPGPDGVFGTNAGGTSDDEIAQVGGVTNVAATVRNLQAAFRKQEGGSAASFFASAGDVIGASPPLSDDYRDEPTIELANAMGLDVSVVGDDEFNRGTQELLRISAATDGRFSDDVTACEGVKPGVDGCFGEDEHAFTGAQYPYLAANVISRDTGQPLLPPYQVLYTPTGARVALIGVVTTRTPTLVPPEGLSDVEFTDEADAVNRWVPRLQADGIEAIGVLMHDGGDTTGPTALDPNGCDELTGPIVGLNERIDPAVDFIVSGFTHGAYNCLLPAPGAEPRLVTQAGSYGRLVTDIRLRLDGRTGDVDRTLGYSAENVPVTRTGPDVELQSILDYWAAGPGNHALQGVPEERSARRPGGSVMTTDSTSRALGIAAIVAAIALLVAAGARFGGGLHRGSR